MTILQHAPSAVFLAVVGGASLIAGDVSANAATQDWTAGLKDFLPAINACAMRAPKGDNLADVSIAWRESDQLVGTHLIVRFAAGAKYFECFADPRSRIVKSFKELPDGTPKREGEGDPLYTPGADSVICLVPCKTRFVDVKDKAGKNVGLLSYRDETAAN